MDYYYSDTPQIMSNARDVAAINGAFHVAAGILGFIFLFVAVIGVLQIVAMWKMFTKAGEEGWKSIIPIYNMVILFKIAGISPWLLLIFLASAIPFVGPIAIFGLMIYLSINLSKAFGKDTAFTVLLVLLPTIGYLILGLSKNISYVGNNSAQPSNVANSQGYGPEQQSGPVNSQGAAPVPPQGYGPAQPNGPVNPQVVAPEPPSAPVPPQGFEPMQPSEPVNPQVVAPEPPSTPMPPQGFEPMQPNEPTNPPTGMNQ